MTTPEEIPTRVWGIGCNIAFQQDPAGGFSPDLTTRPSHGFLQELIRKGLMAPELSFDFEELPDGAQLLLVPMDAELEVEVFPAERDPEPSRSPAPLAVAGGIAIGVASSAIWDATKAVGKVILSGPVTSGVYNPPINPRPPIRPGGGPYFAV